MCVCEYVCRCTCVHVRDESQRTTSSVVLHGSLVFETVSHWSGTHGVLERPASESQIPILTRPPIIGLMSVCHHTELLFTWVLKLELQVFRLSGQLQSLFSNERSAVTSLSL